MSISTPRITKRRPNSPLLAETLRPDYTADTFYQPRLDLRTACYDAGFGYGSTGNRYYFRAGRVAMACAANAGMRARGRHWYALGIADGVCGRWGPIRRRARGAPD